MVVSRDPVSVATFVDVRGRVGCFSGGIIRLIDVLPGNTLRRIGVGVCLL